MAGAVLGDVAILTFADLASFPADNTSGTKGRLALAEDTGLVYRDDGTDWVLFSTLLLLGTGADEAAAGDDARLSNARTPTAHATSHESGGGDPLTAANLAGLAEFVRDTIAAALVAGTRVTVTVNDGADTITVASDDTTTAEFVRDTIATALTAGTGMTVTPNDGSDIITIATTITQYTDEMVDDRVAALLVEGTNITLTYDDGAGTLTIDASGGGGGHEVQDDGTPLAQRAALNFIPGASGVTITDDAGGDATVIDFSALTGGGGGGGGAVKLIEEIVLGADGPSFTFDADLSGYRLWKLVGSVRGGASGTNIDAILARFNGDTSAVYDNEFMINYNVFGSGSDMGRTSMIIATATRDGWPFWTNIDAEIPYPDRTDTDKTIQSRSHYRIGTGAGEFRDELIHGIWRPGTSAAITDLTLTINGGGDFKAGSRFALYGYDDTGNGITPIVLGAWTDLPMAAGWVSDEGTDYPPQYRILGDLVQLRGRYFKSSGTASTPVTIATLPVGARPTQRAAGTGVEIATGAYTPSFMFIEPDGDVIIQNTGIGSYVGAGWLDGVQFSLTAADALATGWGGGVAEPSAIVWQPEMGVQVVGSGYAFDAVRDGQPVWFTTAQNDAIGFYSAISAGDYTLRLFHGAWNGAGIIKVQLDGVDIGVSWDAYFAVSGGSSVPAYREVALTVPAGSGIREVRVVVATKNGSSTSYQMQLGRVSLTPVP